MAVVVVVKMVVVVKVVMVVVVKVVMKVSSHLISFRLISSPLDNGCYEEFCSDSAAAMVLQGSFVSFARTNRAGSIVIVHYARRVRAVMDDILDHVEGKVQYKTQEKKEQEKERKEDCKAAKMVSRQSAPRGSPFPYSLAGQMICSGKFKLQSAPRPLNPLYPGKIELENQADLRVAQKKRRKRKEKKKKAEKKRRKKKDAATIANRAKKRIGELTVRCENKAKAIAKKEEEKKSRENKGNTDTKIYKDICDKVKSYGVQLSFLNQQLEEAIKQYWENGTSSGSRSKKDQAIAMIVKEYKASLEKKK